MPSGFFNMGRVDPDLQARVEASCDCVGLAKERRTLEGEISQLNSERDALWDELQARRPWYTVEERSRETNAAVLQILRDADAIGVSIEWHWERIETIEKEIGRWEMRRSELCL